MPNTRRGFIDSYHSSRLTHLTGTSYPASPTTIYLGVYAGKLPLSDGSSGSEISPATRSTLTLGSTQTDANGRQYITNASAITGIVLTNTSPATVVGYGIFTANSGGTPIYVDILPDPFQVSVGQTISIPAGAIRVYAEPPTL
jgi:hypothetical protein